MRRAVCAAALCLALVLAVAAPAGAATADKQDKCFGGATIVGFVGDGAMAEARVSVSLKGATGVEGEPDYVPAYGWVNCASDVPGLSFTFETSDLDITADGIGWATGYIADGTRYDVLVLDGGTPGIGLDEVWLIHYAPEGPAVSFWSVVAGNLSVQNK